MTAGEIGESSEGHFTTTPFTSCHPSAAVSHFQFLYLVCVGVVVVVTTRLCVSAGSPQKEKGQSRLFFFRRN